MFCKHYCYSLVWLYLEAVTAVIILAWTPKICLECLLCCNQSLVRSSHHTTTGNDSFRSVMEQIIFVLFKDTNCLIRNLKHRCSPRSVPRTASSTSFDLRKKSFRSQRDATATSFPCNDISHEDNNKWTIVMVSFLIA